MTIGALGFLSPWLLLGLGLLPVIWWLLRTTPPQPRRIRFPATRLLKGLFSAKQTPVRSPWWLTALRMLAAALIILGLAEPLINPADRTLSGSGPVVLAVDNDWAAAPHWDVRRTTLLNLIDEAERQARPVMVAPTAIGQPVSAFPLQAAAAARESLAAIQPMPYAPDRESAAAAIAQGIGQMTDTSIVWLSDGIDHRNSRAFLDRLQQIAGSTGDVTMMSPGSGDEPVALRLAAGETSNANALAVEVARTGGPPRALSVRALSGRGQPLGETRLSLGAGATKASGSIDLPLELRNQVMRLEVMGERSAGAVHLLDSGSRWNRVGVISGTGFEQSQPLLAPLFYLERALGPYSQVIKSDDKNSAAAITSLMQQNVSVLMLADIGQLTGAMAGRVTEWVEGGGVLVRFASQRLEDGGDDLLPVTLRLGGRSLGGALSWEVPQPLAPFEENSLFAGLTPSDDVRITRQVLADPALLSDATRIWARLGDGTPLVTATRRKEGWIVLFHVTASPDWSNLPMSGLFVEMLRRVIRLTGLADIEGAAVADVSETSALSAPGAILAPTLTLDGFGDAVPAPPTAEPLALATAAGTSPDARHPPGIYGPPGGSVALNVFGPLDELQPAATASVSVKQAAYGAGAAQSLKPIALAIAMGLILIDVIAILLLQSGLRLWPRRGATAALAFALVLAPVLLPSDAQAQASSDDFALKAALETRLAYVLTGNPEIDDTSRAGLFGLSRILAQRTAVEPDAPIGVDILKDELAFFPVLYWPVESTAEELPEATLARVDAFMKGGGMIIFDTRDAADAQLSFDGSPTPGSEALTRLVAKLDMPRLEPAPPGHVVTKSFYLLKSFPGRYDSSPLWVAASLHSANSSSPDDFGVEGEIDAETAAAAGLNLREDDGVSPIIVTGNDLAAAWAVDADEQPINAVVPGGEEQREMAYRVGVNIVMYALTGNYKADQVHIPALLERLGQ